MGEAVVPEHDIAGIAVAVDRLLTVVELANDIVFGRRLVEILRGVGLVEFFVAARPDGKRATARWHEIDIADDAEVEGMGIAVTGQRRDGVLAIG